MKLKFKFLITSVVLLLLSLNSFCFATNTNNEAMLISDTSNFKESETIYSDLYVANKSEYEIKNTINGNVFATVDTLSINPIDNGGIVQGNLFVTANSVSVKSDVTYSDSQKDDLGNPIITINKYSTISGNVFLIADKFVLEPGCQINGDLYVCANEVDLKQNSKINGNVFICAKKFNLDAEIGENLYAAAECFDMKYYGFISRDLHLTSQETNLNGWIYRNSFITTKNLTTQDKFINQGDFTLTDANNLTFSGEILGNAVINAKNINFKNKDNDKNLTCKISGNLSYSSKQEIKIPDQTVKKEITYSNYTNTSLKNTISNIWNYVLNLITLLASVYVIFLLFSKFATKYLDKISNISILTLLKNLGIGLGFLVLIPIISILLLITGIGSIFGLIILLVYIILLLVAKPIFIISIAKFTKDKLSNKLSVNIYISILAISVILSLISLIPYLGFIISMLVNLTGLGIIAKNLIRIKNK